MARVASNADINIDVLNKILDRIEKNEKQIVQLKLNIDSHAHQLDQIDFSHGVQTTNNITFTWTGDTAGHGAITWSGGWLKDKNASSSNLTQPFSAAPGHFHVVPILANATGLTGLNPNTYYWMVWNKQQQQMIATTDVSFGLQNFNNFVVCQVFTGTTNQTGSAGGGGSLGGVEFSGTKYKNF